MSSSFITDLASKINKEVKSDVAQRLGDKPKFCSVVSSGSLLIDRALGVGGFPIHGISELYGPTSCGKSTLAQMVVANVQRSGKIAAYIDAEHTLDPIYATALGIDVDDLLLVQPDYGEQALNIADAILQEPSVGIVVVDSVSALTPKAELDGEIGDQFVGLQARMMSQAMRKLTGTVAKSNAILLFINQIRNKIGVSFGNPNVTSGGEALRFFSTVRVEMTMGSALKEEGEFAHARTPNVKIIKNKKAPPLKEAVVELEFGKGIRVAPECLILGLELDLIQKTGNSYSYNGEKFAGSKDGAVEYIEQNLQDELVAKIREKLFITP